MRTLRTVRHAVFGAMLAAATLARADVITDWNQTAIDVMKAANVAGNPWTRSMAMMNVAMSDAVNTVQNRYTRFIADGPRAPKASAEAAAAGAAREMLLRLYPDQKERISQAYAASIAAVAEGTAKNEGALIGEQAAAAVFAERANDDIQRARHVSAADHARRVDPDDTAAVPAVRHCQALGLQDRR